jgi:hypothetical protein
VPLAMMFHSPRSPVFLLISQVGTPPSVNASRSKFPTSAKTAGGVQSPVGSGPSGRARVLGDQCIVARVRRFGGKVAVSFASHATAPGVRCHAAPHSVT